MKFKVKFFGSKIPKEPIRLVRHFIVEADSKENVESVLKKKYGYKVINGLKIHEYIE